MFHAALGFSGSLTTVTSGSPTIVQQVTGTTSAGSSIPLTISSPTVGHVLILCFSSEDSGISGVSGGSGNLWLEPVFAFPNLFDLEVWTSVVVTPDTTVTVSISFGHGYASLSEWSGLPPNMAVDVTNTTFDTGSTAGSSSSAVTNIANDLILGLLATDAASYTGPSGGFTAFTDPSPFELAAAYRLVSSTGTYTAGWTLNTASDYDGLILALTRPTGLVAWNNVIDSLLTSGTSATTGTVTLTAGRLYLFGVANSKASAPTTPTVSGGPTWTNEQSVAFATIASPTNRITVFRAVPVSNYTGTITVDFGGNSQTMIQGSIQEFTGVDTTTNNGVVQSAVNSTNSATSITATLGAFGSARNGTFEFSAHTNTGSSGVPPGWIALDQATPTGHWIEQQYRGDNATSVVSSWPSATAAAIIALEMKSS